LRAGCSGEARDAFAAAPGNSLNHRTMADANKVVVITGAARGLGLALTRTLIEMGHVVVGCGKRQPLIHALQKQFGKPNLFTVVDVSSDAHVKAWSRQVLTQIGPPHLLLNNAGMILEPQALWEVSDYALARIIDANIRGTANTIRYFVPAMLARKSGVIVNFSSGWGRSTDPYMAPYCMTKWAIEGLTRALAQELPEGMAAVAYNPGIIDTDMLRTCFGGDAANYPSPEEWSHEAAAFLMGLGAEHNGQSVSNPS
jgi:NAD(P)-dependent dehydrogenase (short-subunit alcohol dehydrogenase family)